MCRCYYIPRPIRLSEGKSAASEYLDIDASSASQRSGGIRSVSPDENPLTLGCISGERDYCKRGLGIAEIPFNEKQKAK